MTDQSSSIGLHFVERIDIGEEPVGSALDYIHMRFGGFLCISEESVVYYRNEEEFANMTGREPSVSLPRYQDSKDDSDYFYVDRWHTDYTGGGCWIDTIHLHSGMVICLTDESLNVFTDDEEREQEWEGWNMGVDFYKKRSMSFPETTVDPAEYRGNDYGNDEPAPTFRLKKTNEEIVEEYADMDMFDYEEHEDDDVRIHRVPGGFIFEVRFVQSVSTTFIPFPEGRV